MDDRPAVRCPCGHSFEAASTTPGRELTCPSCGKPFVPVRTATARRVAPEVPASPIPGYRFLKRVGSGGMGDVYLAHQESLDRQVAVKLLPPELATDQAYVEKFLKEARSAAKVSHENIVAAVDAGQAGGRAFFVMEYVAGESLHALIRKRKAIPEAEALEFARQIARGLRHAHRHGLIHRDIKPKNILVTKEGQAKICDFGLARLLKETDGDEQFYTTPAYASPEQCRAEPAVDHRTDIYSLGVSLFEMLTGRRPFAAEKSRDLMAKHVSEPPPSPRALNPAVSEAASQLVLRMLRKSPAERFADYDQLLAALEVRRPKRLLLAGAAAAALVVVGAALFLLLRPVERPAPPPPPAAARPPEVDRDLLSARQLQAQASNKPAEYPAVRARWKELEEKYRGKPHHSLFSTPLMEFEAKMAKEADAVATSLLEKAEDAIQKGKPMDALRALRSVPEALARSEAGQRVAARALEVERALDQKVRAELQACHELVTAGKFDEARGRSHALKASLGEDGPGVYKQSFDDLARRLDTEQAAALKRTVEPPKPEPAPSPAPLPAPKPVAPANAPATEPAKPALPASPLAPHLAVLRDAALRAELEKRDAAAAGFAAVGATSALHRAAAHFLSKPEAEWKLDGPAGAGLAEVLASPIYESAEQAGLEAHLQAFTLIASKIAACGSAPADALQLFACAHAHEISVRKGAISPVTALQARLARGAASGSWGPPASVARIEMASVLVRAPGPWLLRAAEAGQAGTDFPSRALVTLCAMKEITLDAALAADRWKKLGVGAPDPAWTRMADQISERLRLAMPCDSCGSQGRHPCALCVGAGIIPCVTCTGTGSVSDDGGGGGKITCTACKARKAGLCPGCNGAKSLRCSACDGKKTRAQLPGGPWRWIADLGLCEGCRGTGSLFAQASWPCSNCDGNGRILSLVPKEFARTPAWVRTREGRALLPALRWLARHQSPDGRWDADAWNKNCPEPGCEAPVAASGVPTGFDLGTTSLVLLAFLCAGVGPESDLEGLGPVPAGTTVSQALAWLLAAQKPDGHLASGSSVKPVFEHLLATAALATALVAAPPSSEKDRLTLRDAAQRAVKWALSNQTKGGGWGYTTQATSDTWVTSWGGLALVAARDAGIEIPKLNLNYLIQWYDSVTDKTDLHLGYTPQQMGKVNLPGNEAFLGHDTLSAFGGLVRMGLEGRPTTALAAAEKTLQRDLPNPDPNRRDYAYWQWGTVFLAHREQRKGAQWTSWSNALYRELAALGETADTCALGSFPPNDRWGVSGGRVYATAMNALSLSTAAGLRPLVPARTK